MIIVKVRLLVRRLSCGGFEHVVLDCIYCIIYK